jgi:3-hydroxyisobutyrate dehydrogenase
MDSIRTSSQMLGWIGTGRMGFALADRLASAGTPLKVWNRTASKAMSLEQKGCIIVDQPEALGSCDIVFMILATHDDIDHVLFGKSGLLAGNNQPGIIVDITSIGQDESAAIRERLSARGIDFIAAPVSGNARVISAGKLSFVASGPEVAFRNIEPYLHILARSVSYVGDGDQARIAKICHNLMLGVVMQNLCEILVLAEKAGLKRHDLMAFLNSSVMGSMFTKYKSPALVNLDFNVTFTPELMLKDLDLGLTMARRCGVPMPTTSVTRDLVESLVDHGYNQDFSQLLLLEAAAAGLSLTPEHNAIDDGL